MKNLISGDKTLLMIVPVIMIFLSAFVVAMVGSNADLLEVTLDTVDQNGQHINGSVSFGGIDPVTGVDFTWQAAPYTRSDVITNGGSGLVIAQYGGERMSATITLWKDTTYQINSLTNEVTSVSIPGATKVNFVFIPEEVQEPTEEPLNITFDTVDQYGNHINGAVDLAVVAWQTAPYISTGLFTNGSTTLVTGVSGGRTVRDIGLTLWKDTTYQIDAVTYRIDTEFTPGITRVNFVFIISLTDVTQNLITTIENLNLLQGTENSLTSKLDNVIKLLDTGEENAAINVLNALINQIKALGGKQLTSEEADELIRIIEAIVDGIG